MIFLSAGLSFLLGDLLMGLGRGLSLWCFAALAASLPIPFVAAGQNLILYSVVPADRQGSVFALRNGIQFATIPVALLLGGFLADNVFEPFMSSRLPPARLLGKLLGMGPGSGMALMFLCTGILGGLFCLAAYRYAKGKSLDIPHK